MTVALVNGRVLLEDGFADGVAVLLEGERIAAIAPRDDARVRAATAFDLHGGTLAPGFIDCQVNGGGGVLFNDRPDADGIATIARAHRRFGTTGLLPTLISDDFDTMRAAAASVRRALEGGVPGVLGIHLEGPFLAAQRKGIHDPSFFRVPDERDFNLFGTTAGKTLLTLAPEQVSPAVVRLLAGFGVIVAAGHSAASYEETRAALDAGLRGFTHLYNAMSPLTSRAPGVVGAALEDRHSWCGLIMDGHHVHPGAARVALAAKPRGKLFLVTDAMPPVGGASDTFVLNGETIACRDGLCTNAQGVLAGSALDMAGAVRNAVAMLKVPPDEALRMAATYPADFLGLADRGRIAPGAIADLVLLDDRLSVRATWIAGADEVY